ncbi:MAG: phosphate-starvation-inducible PsiE family protein [bacterium]
MESLKIIFDHYNFTADDVERLKAVLPIFEDHVDDCVKYLHNRIRMLGNKEMSDSLMRHPLLVQYHREWLLDLFRGVYDKNYYTHLKRVGKVHMQEDIQPHYVSVSMNFVRAYLMDLLSEKIEDRQQRTLFKESINKIIDINLDIVTNSYLEEEIQTLSAGYKVKTALVTFAERFSGAMNLVLVIALMIITLGVVGLFIHDLMGLLSHAGEEMGSGIGLSIVTILGSVLILWIMIELMNTEIDHLKGGKFNISVFIGVALVTFIRDLMIVTLKHEETKVGYYLIGVILVLGVVYWLVVKTERRS